MRRREIYNQGLIPYEWTLSSWFGVSQDEAQKNALINFNDLPKPIGNTISTINKPFQPIENVLY